MIRPTDEEKQEIKQGLKEISEGKIVPLNVLENSHRVLLTKEEIDKATFGKEGYDNNIARAQLKELHEWGEEQCQGHHTSGIWFKRRECPKCWQALLEEVK